MEFLTAALVSTAASPWIIAILFACCMLDGFLPPVPAEIAVVTAATVAWTTGSPLLIPVIVGSAAGVWLGDNIAYLLGRRLGWAPFRWMRKGPVARASAQARIQLADRPASVIVTGRFLPVLRVVINMAAGASQMPRRRFLFLSFAAAVTWTSCTVVVAILAGAFLQAQPLLAAVVAVLFAMATGYLVDRAVAGRRAVQQRRISG